MDMTPDEREQLTDILFQLLNRTDAKTVRELAAGGPGTIFQMIQAFGGMSASQRGMMTMHLAELVQMESIPIPETILFGILCRIARKNRLKTYKTYVIIEVNHRECYVSVMLL